MQKWLCKIILFNEISDQSILTGMTWISGLFEIKQDTGDIFAVSDIDREKNAMYLLDIKVSDNDPVQAKSNYTQINLRVKDINDNTPKFDNSTISIQLLENTAYNTHILKVRNNYSFHSVITP